MMKPGFLSYMTMCTAMLVPYIAQAAGGDQLITVEINKGQMVHLDRPASSVVISDPATADIQVVSPKLLFVRGKKVGETSFYAIDNHDETIESAVIDVTHNLSQLARAIKRVAPDSDVGFKTVDGGLVLDGFANSVSDSEHIRDIAQSFLAYNEKMVNMIKTNGSDQVMLKVKIVEMSRNDLKKFGINLQNAFNTGVGGLALEVAQGADIGVNNSTNNPFTLNNGSVPVDTGRTGLLDRAGSPDTGILARWHGGAQTSMVDALETQGLANVLAEPNLTTTSGKSASFLAGGQFPLPVKDQNGAITIQYKSFGVSLNFTPVVMNKNRISITVAPEVSTLDFSNPIQVAGITYPILQTRQASTVVELGSGDSFALAGLIKNQTSNNINKFPGLGDVPVLGALFRRISCIRWRRHRNCKRRWMAIRRLTTSSA
jgi:pilus assembly protein CpaC